MEREKPEFLNVMNIISQMVQVHLYRGEGEATEYLILKRAGDEPIYPNLWQVVTGMTEDGETAVQAAVREVKEETGIEAEALTPVPYVATFFSPRSDAVNLVPVFACRVAHDLDVQLSDEHQQFRWVRYDEAVETLVLPSHREGTRILKEYLVSGRLTVFPGA